MKKITKSNNQKFRWLLNGVLMGLGAECEESYDHESTKGYHESWRLETKYGPLQVFLSDCVFHYAFHSRFEDVELASRFVSCNVYSGKWNHYAHGDATPEGSAYIFADYLRAVAGARIEEPAQGVSHV